MNSKQSRILLVSCLLGLLVACEPQGPKDVTLSAPTNAVAPTTSAEDKIISLTYSAPESQAALEHAIAELKAQGFDRCAKVSPNWQTYVVQREGKRIETLRYEEWLFRDLPPRMATVALVRQPEGVQVTVEVVQLLNGGAVLGHRKRHCGTSAPAP